MSNSAKIAYASMQEETRRSYTETSLWLRDARQALAETVPAEQAEKEHAALLAQFDFLNNRRLIFIHPELLVSTHLSLTLALTPTLTLTLSLYRSFTLTLALTPNPNTLNRIA